jgi:hypothetical protein
MIRYTPSSSGHHRYHLVEGRPSLTPGIYSTGLYPEYKDDRRPFMKLVLGAEVYYAKVKGFVIFVM